MKPTQVLLLGATLDSDNCGIGALAMGALSIIVHRYPQCEIHFVDYGHHPTRTSTEVNGESLSIGLINLRFSKKLWLPNNIIWLLLLAVSSRIAGRFLGNRMLAGNPWLRQLARADLAVAVSGGDSFSDIYGLGRFFYMALPQLLVILLGRPLVLLPQTIGPLRTALARRVAKFIINHAQISYSRDRNGVIGTVQSLKLDKDHPKLAFSYDMGFILEPRKPARVDLPIFNSFAAASRPLVGLNISGLLSMGGYSGKNMFDLQCDYLELIERMVEFLIESRQVNVLLVPHVFGTAAESDIHAVDAIFNKLKDRYPTQLSRVTASHNPNEIKYVIGQCDLFIGSRMHACIAALSQGVPAVGIAYSQKFAGVLGSIGVGHLVADPRQIGIDHIIAMIDKALSERAVIRSHLEKTMPDVQSQVLNVLVGVT
jgi:polysaccharide pyruvyl transferase WcaK-like protein